MGNGEVYDRFVFVVCFVYLILTLFFDFVFLFPYIGNSHCFLITQGVIKNIILSFNLCDKLRTKRRANCFHENL